MDQGSINGLAYQSIGQVLRTYVDRGNRWRVTPLNYYRFSWAAQLVCYAAPGNAISEH
jgi:hypothetical protein